MLNYSISYAYFPIFTALKNFPGLSILIDKYILLQTWAKVYPRGAREAIAISGLPLPWKRLWSKNLHFEQFVIRIYISLNHKFRVTSSLEEQNDHFSLFLHQIYKGSVSLNLTPPLEANILNHRHTGLQWKYVLSSAFASIVTECNCLWWNILVITFFNIFVK